MCWSSKGSSASKPSTPRGSSVRSAVPARPCAPGADIDIVAAIRSALTRARAVEAGRLVALMEEEQQLIETQREMFGAAAELASAAEARVLSARLATAEDGSAL